MPCAAQLADGVSSVDRTLPEKNGWDALDLQIDDLWESLCRFWMKAASRSGGTCARYRTSQNASVGGPEDDSGARGSRTEASA